MPRKQFPISDAAGVVHESDLVRLAKAGGVFLGDEMDAGNAGVLKPRSAQTAISYQFDIRKLVTCVGREAPKPRSPGAADWETVCTEARKSPSKGVSGVSGKRFWGPRDGSRRLTSLSSVGPCLRKCYWPGYPLSSENKFLAVD